MNDAHAADLVWRFQYQEDLEREAPSTFGAFAVGGVSEETSAPFADDRLEAQERAARIDAALKRLRTKPVSLARVLFLRYGATDVDRHAKSVLREVALVASVTREAGQWAERLTGRAPRHRSHDVRDWLAEVCRRAEAHEISGEEYIALNEVRDAAELLLKVAERAYEKSAGGAGGSPVSEEGTAAKVPKAFYTGPELARALGISRWSVRGWLEGKKIPYEMRRREGAVAGGRLIVMTADLRTFAPSYFASVQRGASAE